EDAEECPRRAVVAQDLVGIDAADVETPVRPPGYAGGAVQPAIGELADEGTHRLSNPAVTFGRRHVVEGYPYIIISHGPYAHNRRTARRRRDQFERLVGLGNAVTIDRHLYSLRRLAVGEGDCTRRGDIIRTGSSRVVGRRPIHRQRSAEASGSPN